MSSLNKQNTLKSEPSKGSDFTFLFGKQNYIWMAVGIGLIALGFILMTGHDANTTPEGLHDVTYWNEEIYSWRRIRLAPFLVIAGFIVEIYAILINPTNNN